MFKFLIFSLIILLFGCSNAVETIQVEADKTNVDKPQIVEEKQPCNFNLEGKLKTFYSPIPDDFRDVERDEKILQEIKNCPREEIVKSLENLQKSKKKDIEIQAKTAYFLIKLNYNRVENGKLLFSTYSAKIKEYFKKVDQGKYDDDFYLDRLMDLICQVISKEDEEQEFLSDAFDLVPLSDGAMSETLSATLADQFEKSPKVFLKKLKPKSNKIRQQTYDFIFYQISKDKAFQHLMPISKDSEVYSMVEEIQKFAKNKKDGN
jgi:hypothetical protein